jgi:hypothetical protein
MAVLPTSSFRLAQPLAIGVQPLQPLRQGMASVGDVQQACLPYGFGSRRRGSIGGRVPAGEPVFSWGAKKNRA